MPSAQHANTTATLITMHALVLGGLIAALFSQAQASDLAKERRWAEQIEDALLDGEPVYLNDGSSEFLSIETPAESDSPKPTTPKPTTKALILMHGSGVHPDWPTVIQPLRVALAERGWTTLSIQMPVLANDAPYSDYAAVYPEAAARIEAAYQHLKAQGQQRIALIAHSLGAGMAAYALAQQPQAEQQRYIGIALLGISDGGKLPRLDNLSHLSHIQIPILDLSGSDDLPAVLNSQSQRQQAARHNTHYQQRQIPQADHFYEGQDDALIDSVEHWLTQLAPR